MQISREDLTLAAENIDLSEDDYSVREAYEGRYGVSGAGVDLPDNRKVMELLVSLAVVLTEQGRGEDALELASKTQTDSMGFNVIAYWPGVEIAG